VRVYVILVCSIVELLECLNQRSLAAVERHHADTGCPVSHAGNIGVFYEPQ
jgi:hypothetical protein